MLKSFIKEELGKYVRYADRKDEIFIDFSSGEIQVVAPVLIWIQEAIIEYIDGDIIYLYIDYATENDIKLSPEIVSEYVKKYLKDNGVQYVDDIKLTNKQSYQAITFIINKNFLKSFLSKFKEERDEENNDPLWLSDRDYDF